MNDNSYLHWQSPQLKEYDRIWTKISAGERSKTFCLVTTQSFNEGSLDTRTWKCSLSHQLCGKLCVDIVFIKTYGSHLSEKNLLLNESLTEMRCESSKGRWNGQPFVLQVLPNNVVFSSTQWRNQFWSDWSQTVQRIGGSMPGHTVETLVVTNSYKQPPFLNDQFSRTPKFPGWITIFGTSCKRLRPLLELKFDISFDVNP